MARIGHAARRRRHRVNVALPARRVQTRAITAGRRPVLDGFETATQARSGFGLRCPDGLQYGQHMRQADITHQQAADDGVGVGVERIAPLLRVFRVAPAGLLQAVPALWPCVPSKASAVFRTHYRTHQFWCDEMVRRETGERNEFG